MLRGERVVLMARCVCIGLVSIVRLELKRSLLWDEVRCEVAESK